MTEKRFKIGRNAIGMKFICYDGKYILIGTFADTDGLKEVVDLLNGQEEEIQQLKWSNKILRTNKKSCELGRREARKRWVKMDKMRIEHIQLLQKRLKENGLSIYVNGDVE